MCSACFPQLSLLDDASLSSTGSSRASSPASTVLSKRYDILLPFRRTSFPRLAIPRVHSLCSLLGRRVSSQGQELVTRCLQPEITEEQSRTLPSSWGTPIVRLHMFSPTPAGLLAPDHYGVAAWPLVCEQQRLPRKVFRRSIAWLSDWLSTHHRVRYLPQRKTRFRPLVRRYRTGFPPARFR